MKCKKILAMLLALCMVLSTFVAVSAADVVVVDIYEDYEDGIGDTLYGGNVTIATEEFEGENVLVATNSASGAAGWQNLVGFAVTDTEGNHLTQQALPAEGVIEYSFDIYVPAEGGNVGDATFYLRTSNGFPPPGMQTSLNELNGLTTGTWQTFSGTKNVIDCNWAGDTTNDLPVWICLRPNFSGAGEFYLDNVSFTITVPGEEEEPELPPASGDIEFTLAPKNVAGTLEDGVYTVTSAQLKEYSNLADFSDCSANDWLKIIPTTELDPEKTIKVSYEIKAENLVNSVGGAHADRETTLRIRDAQNGNVVPRTTYATNVSVNTGSAQLVEFEIPVASIEGYHHFGISLNMQNPLTYGDGSEYFVISNVAVEYVGDDNQGGGQGGGQGGSPSVPGGNDPVIPEPSDEITFTLERAVNAGTNNGNAYPAVGELNEDVFTATLANVREYTVSRNGDVVANYGGDCGYQPWVWIMLDEEIDTDEDWYVSFDLTTEGIINSLGAEYETLDEGIRVRFYNDNTEVNTSYRPNQVVTVNTGEAVNIGCQVDTEQLSGPVNKIGLVVNVGSSVKVNEYADSDAYFEISNIEVAMGEYVAPEEEPDEPVDPDEPNVPDTPDDPEDPEITDELTYETIADLGSDFETDMGDVQVGTTNIAGEIVDLDGEKVLKATSSGSTTHNGIIGVAIKDADGNEIDVADLQPYDKITWSVDVYMESTSGLPGNNGATIALRYGNWTPTAAMANLAQFGTNNVTAGQWKTFSGTKFVDDISWQATNTDGTCWFLVRPNFTGEAVMYVDNVSFTVEKEFVPTITEVTEVETGADNVVLNVETDGIIDIESLADYILIDGAAVNTENVTVEAVDATNTLVTFIGLAPGTEYEIAVTGALNSRDREVTVANEADCTVSVTTVAEVDVEVGISNDTVSFSLTNNLSETETIHVVLLRCKGNTVVDTISVPVEAESGEPVEGSIEVPELGSGEYYRFFAWTYEDGAINSMANLIDLD